MNFQESVSYLYSLGHETLAMKFGLRNTEVLLAALDHPQNDFPKVQIAGTNGKGSVAAFLDSICRRANIRAGLFTSPHLVSITERIRIEGVPVSEEKFAKLTTEVREAAEKLVVEKQLEALPTFFEHLTAIGLLAFARERVGLAILETGLGGRLDSVTAAKAEIVCLTPIDLDHQEFLGNTLNEIATEKAAIIRPDVCAVVCAPQKPEVARVIRGYCRKNGVELTGSAKIIKFHRFEYLQNFTASFKTKNESYKSIDVSLLGKHQLENAATAISLAESLRELDFKISNDEICIGLETARHAGRLEFCRIGQNRFLFDGAHNPAGAGALRDFLEEFIETKITLVFGAMRDKDLSEIAKILFPFAENLILTRADNPRSAAPEDLLKLVSEDFPPDKVFLTATVAEAIKKARELTAPENLVCVTGSLYLIGEAKSITN